MQEKKEEVKAQVQAKAERAKTQAQQTAEHAKQRMPIAPAVAGIAVAVVALWLIRRR